MESMELIEIQRSDADRLAPLVAAFRVTLNGYRGIVSAPKIEAAREEIVEFLDAGMPVFAVEAEGELAGYMVCRIDAPCLWVEHLYVRDEHRRRGVATPQQPRHDRIPPGQEVHSPEHDRDPQALPGRTAHHHHPRGGRRFQLLRG